jgi:ParB-like chromosome segregation protein Spo0J
MRYMRNGKDLGPIKVTPEQTLGAAPTGRYTIVDGNCRVVAARRLGLTELWAC